MSVAWVAVGATVAGAAVSANSANQAKKSQEQAGNSDRAMQQQQFDTQVELQEPFRQSGVAANSRLSTLLGLDAKGGGTGATPYTMDDFIGYNNRIAPNHSFGEAGRTSDSKDQFKLYQSGAYGDDQSAIAARFGFDPAKIAQAKADEEARRSDPAYGSLLRNFTADDLNADPVYQSGLQFGLSEGEKGIERQQSATGSKLSGATLKALARFGNDYGSTKAADSRNRFKDDQNSIYNKLAGVSGAGQQSTNQIGNASQQYASNMSNNITGLGNARAASSIAQGNAWQNGINSAVSGYRNNQPTNGNGVSQALFQQPSSFGVGSTYMDGPFA